MDTLMDQWVAEAKADGEAAEKLTKADPTLPFFTAYIIAQDRRTADKALVRLRAGEPYDRCSARVGSYARLNFALTALDENLVSLDQLLAGLPELWRGSDPDDTDPRFLQLWKAAYHANGGKYVRDGRAIPDNHRYLTVYRGQDAGAPYGIAWSRYRTIAEKFAKGAATREAHRGGVVVEAQVLRTDVLAYLTGRNEEEIIVDPVHIQPR